LLAKTSAWAPHASPSAQNSFLGFISKAGVIPARRLPLPFFHPIFCCTRLRWNGSAKELAHRTYTCNDATTPVNPPPPPPVRILDRQLKTQVSLSPIWNANWRTHAALSPQQTCTTDSRVNPFRCLNGGVRPYLPPSCRQIQMWGYLDDAPFSPATSVVRLVMICQISCPSSSSKAFWFPRPLF